MSWYSEIVAVVRRVIGARLSEVRTHTPAQVVSFDASTNTCSIQPCIKIQRTDDPNHLTTENLPQIDDVPVRHFGSGKCLLTVAPQVGSYGLLHVSDRRLERWLTDGGIVEPISATKFDLSDCVFEPGLYPLATDGDNGKLQSAVRTDRIELRTRNGNTSIAVLANDTVEITNSSGTITVKASGQVDINGHLTVD